MLENSKLRLKELLTQNIENIYPEVRDYIISWIVRIETDKGDMLPFTRGGIIRAFNVLTLSAVTSLFSFLYIVISARRGQGERSAQSACDEAHISSATSRGAVLSFKFLPRSAVIIAIILRLHNSSPPPPPSLYFSLSLCFLASAQ